MKGYIDCPLQCKGTDDSGARSKSAMTTLDEDAIEWRRQSTVVFKVVSHSFGILLVERSVNYSSRHTSNGGKCDAAKNPRGTGAVASTLSHHLSSS